MERKYTKHIGRSGRIWLVPVGEFAGDNIHVAADPAENAKGYQSFRGYGGSKLTFQLEGGGTVELEGPWHSNSDALFKDTGVDVRRCHASKVIIAASVKDNPNPYAFGRLPDEVIFEEKDFKEGPFDRCNVLVKDWVARLKKPLYYKIETGGGGQAGWEYPVEYTTAMRDAFHKATYEKKAG